MPAVTHGRRVLARLGIVISLALVLLAGDRPFAATSAVQLVGRTGASGANTFTTPAIVATGATLLVAVVAVVATSAPAVVSDSSGNTWMPLTAQSIAGQQAGQIFYVANPTVSAAQTFTVTGTAISGSMVVFVFSGIVTASPFDQQNGAKTTGSSSIQPGSITPSVNGELVVTGFTYGVVSAPIVVDNVATSLFTVAGSLGVSGTNYGAFGAWGVQPTAAAINPTWGVLGGTNFTAMIASFKATSLGGGETSAVFAGGS